MTTDPVAPPATLASPPAEPAQDPEWTRRCRTRLRATLEVLGAAPEPLRLADIQTRVAERVPLNDYDSSLTASGAVRAWNNLGWNLTTTFEHAGWLHATSESGFRLTREGREALATYPDPMALYDAGVKAYHSWAAARTEALPDLPASAETDILHGGTGAAHTMRACFPVLAAWNSGDSALSPGSPVWSRTTMTTLRTYLDAASQPIPASLPGLEDLTARTLAAEALVLLIGPFSDMVGSTKRSRVRNPLIPAVDPPGLPVQLSADLEQGFVHGGKALIATPLAMLESFARILEHWWTHPQDARDAGWADPWAFRDLVTGISDVDDRVASLVCLVAHPRSFTTVLRSADRHAIVEVFSDRLDPRPVTSSRTSRPSRLPCRPSRAASQSLRHRTAAAGVEPGSRGRLTSAGWSAASSTSRTGCRPGSARAGSPSRSVGFTQLPNQLTQDALSSLVEDRYGDLQVVKREAKKRDVLAFSLGMQPGDLVTTVDGGTLRLGRVEDGPATLQSIGGTTLLVRPVAWFTEAAPEVKDLPGHVAVGCDSRAKTSST